MAFWDILRAGIINHSLALLRVLLERGYYILFEGGPYMRKYGIYTGLGTTTYYISPFFDREFPEAVLEIHQIYSSPVKGVSVEELLISRSIFQSFLIFMPKKWGLKDFFCSNSKREDAA